MKKQIFILAVTCVFILDACNNSADSSKTQDLKATQQFNIDTTKLKTNEVFYQCPMHPEVISDKSGSCPECGMDLEKIQKK